MRGSLGEILIKRYKEVLALKRANAISIALFVFFCIGKRMKWKEFTLMIMNTTSRILVEKLMVSCFLICTGELSLFSEGLPVCLC